MLKMINRNKKIFNPLFRGNSVKLSKKNNKNKIILVRTSLKLGIKNCENFIFKSN